MRRRWLLLGALVLNLGVAGSHGLALLQRARESPRNDFVAFYTAGLMVRAGEGRALYDLSAQERRQTQLMEGRPLSSGLLPFINPPPVALLFAPLAGLSLRAAFALWSLVQLALLAGLLWFVGRGRPALEHWLAAAAVAATPAMRLTLEQGAFSLVVLVGLLGFHRMLAAGRQRGAGAWLTLGLFKPQLVLLPALALPLGRQWRALAVVAAAAGVLGLAAANGLGLQIWSHWVRALGLVHGQPEALGLHPEDMYNLKGALWQLLGPASWLPGLALAGWAAAGLAAVWLWRGGCRVPDLDLRMAASILLGTFFSLHLYPQDGLLLVAVALLLDAHLRQRDRPRDAFAAVALLSPTLWLVADRLWPQPPVRFPVLLQLVLGAWILRELRHFPDQPEPGRGS